MHFNRFCRFLSSCFTHIMWFLVTYLYFFLRKISKLRFWPCKKSTFRMSGWLYTFFNAVFLHEGTLGEVDCENFHWISLRPIQCSSCNVCMLMCLSHCAWLFIITIRVFVSCHTIYSVRTFFIPIPKGHQNHLNGSKVTVI